MEQKDKVNSQRLHYGKRVKEWGSLGNSEEKCGTVCKCFEKCEILSVTWKKVGQCTPKKACFAKWGGGGGRGVMKYKYLSTIPTCSRLVAPPQMYPQ